MQAAVAVHSCIAYNTREPFFPAGLIPHPECYILLPYSMGCEIQCCATLSQGIHVRSCLGDSPGSFPSNPILLPPAAAAHETFEAPAVW